MLQIRMQLDMYNYLTLYIIEVLVYNYYVIITVLNRVHTFRLKHALQEVMKARVA